MSKRKLEEFKCTQCQLVIQHACATDGKSSLCNKCFQFGSPDYKLQILELDADRIFLDWVCPQLGSDLTYSSALSAGVSSAYIQRYLVTLFSLGRVEDAAETFNASLTKVMKPVGFRNAFLLHGIKLDAKAKSINCNQRAKGDIFCYLTFVRQDKISVLQFVCSYEMKPMTHSTIPPRYNTKAPGNKHFIVS